MHVKALPEFWLARELLLLLLLESVCLAATTAPQARWGGLLERCWLPTQQQCADFPNTAATVESPHCRHVPEQRAEAVGPMLAPQNGRIQTAEMLRVTTYCGP